MKAYHSSARRVNHATTAKREYPIFPRSATVIRQSNLRALVTRLKVCKNFRISPIFHSSSNNPYISLPATTHYTQSFHHEIHHHSPPGCCHSSHCSTQRRYTILPLHPSIPLTNSVPDPEASAITSFLPRDPAARAAFDDILARAVSPATLDKRACGSYDPCCDSSGSRSRATCYGSCGAITGTGGSGYVLGMWPFCGIMT
jgi:hypothetical protein